MGRESTKHGSRVDDELKHETRPLEQGAPVDPRSREAREAEPPGDDDRDVDGRTAPPGSLGSDPVAARRELSRFLRLSAFPAADREALLAEAESQSAPAHVLAALQELPAGETYDTVHEVWAALAGYDDPDAAARTEPLSDADR